MAQGRIPRRDPSTGRYEKAQDDDEPETEVGGPGPTRPAPPDEVVVFLYLDRKTGRVRVDDEFSTPAETLHALDEGLAVYEREYFPERADG